MCYNIIIIKEIILKTIESVLYNKFGSGTMLKRIILNTSCVKKYRRRSCIYKDRNE